MSLIILKGVVVCCLITIGSSSFAQDVTWPRPDLLTAYFPFNSLTNLEDYAFGMKPETSGSLGVVMKRINGPFGIPHTSYTVTDFVANALLGEYRHLNLTSSFTVSFYYYSEMGKPGAVLSALDQLAIALIPPNILSLKVLTPDVNGTSKWTQLDFPIFQKSEWNFFAISYNKSEKNMKVSGKDGKILSQVSVDAVTSGPATYLGTFVGWAIDTGEYANMWTTDAIACLMVYRDALEPSEIAQLPGVCEKQKSYAPRLAASIFLPLASVFLQYLISRLRETK